MKFISSERHFEYLLIQLQSQNLSFCEVFLEISYFRVQHIIEIDLAKSQICSFLIAMNHKFCISVGITKLVAFSVSGCYQGHP